MVILWTSSGPSAIRSVRMCAYIVRFGLCAGSAVVEVNCWGVCHSGMANITGGELPRGLRLWDGAACATWTLLARVAAGTSGRGNRRATVPELGIMKRAVSRDAVRC